MSLVQKRRKESLEKELAARQRDYEATDTKYRRETRPSEKNSLKDELEHLLADMERIEYELEGLISEKEQHLINILQSIFQQFSSNIRSAYRFASPAARPISVDASLYQLVDDLKLRNNGEEYAPLYKFIGYLLKDSALESNFELKGKLANWLKEEVENVSPLLDMIEQEKQNNQGQSCLLVIIKKQESQYIVEAFLINYIDSTIKDCHQIKTNKQAAWLTDQNFKNMPSLFQQFRKIIAEEYKNVIHQLHIFLPTDLINYPVDLWKSDEEEEEEFLTTLGEEYEVMIRYSERLEYDNEPILKWRNKGHKIKNKLNEKASDILFLANSSNPKKLFLDLKNNAVIGVKMPSISNQKNLGKLFFKAGIPLAVWLRRSLDDEMDNLLNDALLHQLPCWVKDKRSKVLESDNPDTHCGRHLALLWDDPDLVPPKQITSQENLENN